MTDDRYTEKYKGFKLLVVEYRQGKCEGRAWATGEGLKNHSVSGANKEEVLVELKRLADLDDIERLETFRKTLPERHRELFIREKREWRGVRPVTRFHRTSHCYKCKANVDNSIDLECVACGWIICNDCAACGCYYDAA